MSTKTVLKMDHKKDEDKLLTRLFQDQRKAEETGGPDFSAVYGKAKIKFRNMRTLKLGIGLAISLILLTGLALLTKRASVTEGEIPVAKAGISLYDRLVTDGKIVTNDIHFAFDRADLKPQSMTIIRSIAAMMEEHPDVRLSIEGHSDNQGTDAYNLELSTLRSEEVKKALVQLGIDRSRLRAKGYGESKPVADNNTDAGRARNRRVEFVSF